MKYIVKWGEGQTQKCSTKKEAIELAREILNNFSNVTIKKLKLLETE